MSFTLHQVPSPGSSLHTPLWHVIESSNVTQDNFRYVFILYWSDGVNVYPITTCKVPPDGVLGIIDVAPIVRDFVIPYFTPGAAGAPALPVSWNTDDVQLSYSVFYYEEYTVAGVPTSNYLADGVYAGWNAYSAHLAQNFPYTPYQGHSPVLTDRNREISAERGLPILIPFLSSTSYTDLGLILYTYDEFGNQIDTSGVEDISAFTKSLLEIDVSIDSLNSGTVISNFIPVDSPLYGFQFTDSAVPITDEFRVRPTCPRPTTKHLVFLNRFGGYESMHFTGVNREEVSVMRQEFERREMTIIGNTVRAYDGNRVYAGGHTSYATRREQSYKLQTNWLNDTDHVWLQQLVASAEVYLKEDAFYYPVKVKTMKWGAKYTAVDKMYQLELEIETRPIMSQYR